MIKGVLRMFCHRWHHNHRSDMMGSKLAMVLVTGTLVYLGAKTIHHMMHD